MSHLRTLFIGILLIFLALNLRIPFIATFLCQSSSHIFKIFSLFLVFLFKIVYHARKCIRIIMFPFLFNGLQIIKRKAILITLLSPFKPFIFKRNWFIAVPDFHLAHKRVKLMIHFLRKRFNSQTEYRFHAFFFKFFRFDKYKLSKHFLIGHDKLLFLRI